jgi:hypothetical protein
LEHVAVGSSVKVVVFHFFLEFALAFGDAKVADCVEVPAKKVAIDQVNQCSQGQRAAVQATPKHLCFVGFRRTAEMLAKEFAEVFCRRGHLRPCNDRTDRSLCPNAGSKGYTGALRLAVEWVTRILLFGLDLFVNAGIGVHSLAIFLSLNALAGTEFVVKKDCLRWSRQRAKWRAQF